MADATTNHVDHVPGRVGGSGEKKSLAAAVPGVLIGLAVIARFTITKDSIRLAFALLFTLAAIDPMRNVAVVAVAIVLLTIHGVTHVCRYLMAAVRG
jgi:hypothetical protein